jgi:hypothetical protein
VRRELGLDDIVASIVKDERDHCHHEFADS